MTPRLFRGAASLFPVALAPRSLCPVTLRGPPGGGPIRYAVFTKRFSFSWWGPGPRFCTCPSFIIWGAPFMRGERGDSGFQTRGGLGFPPLGGYFGMNKPGEGVGWYDENQKGVVVGDPGNSVILGAAAPRWATPGPGVPDGPGNSLALPFLMGVPATGFLTCPCFIKLGFTSAYG
ncbi:hypothetical protein JTE90_011098 [Oedothorax gibbosus]|uniref:Uncharacterized protein n=1 Tax=Oedothorax gibbosus TaxID=931172 RepID=A0AAV6TSL2_9ARAC|nr:hypothetical protein JTE90_011098 [Oedothorax gibbosus]